METRGKDVRGRKQEGKEKRERKETGEKDVRGRKQEGRM